MRCDERWILSQFRVGPRRRSDLGAIIDSQSVVSKYDILSFAISQAFPRAHPLVESERYLAVPPDCVRLASTRRVGQLLVGRVSQKYWKSPCAFLRNKTFYGPKDAPRRWYVRIARHFREYQPPPRKMDLCLFSKRGVTHVPMRGDDSVARR